MVSYVLLSHKGQLKNKVRETVHHVLAIDHFIAILYSLAMISFQ